MVIAISATEIVMASVPKMATAMAAVLVATTAVDSTAGGHRQQSTKRLMEEMRVGDCDSDGSSNCNRSGNGDSINNDTKADAIYC